MRTYRLVRHFGLLFLATFGVSCTPAEDVTGQSTGPALKNGDELLLELKLAMMDDASDAALLTKFPDEPLRINLVIGETSEIPVEPPYRLAVTPFLDIDKPQSVHLRFEPSGMVGEAGVQEILSSTYELPQRAGQAASRTDFYSEDFSMSAVLHWPSP
jgi:hypothetical protein